MNKHFQIATIRISVDVEHEGDRLPAGTHTIRMPASYSEEEVTGVDILHDRAISVISENDLHQLEGHAAIAHAEATGRTLCKYADPTETDRVGLSVEQARDVASEDPGLLYISVPYTEALEVREDDVGHVWLIAVDEMLAIDMGTGADRLKGTAATDVELYRAADGWNPEDTPDNLYPAHSLDSARLLATARFDGSDWAWREEEPAHGPDAQAYLEGTGLTAESPLRN